MAANLKYAVGTNLVHRQDDGLTAEVVEIKLFNGIEHYRIQVRPAHVHNASVWLSGFGLDREFARVQRAKSLVEFDDAPLLRAVTRFMRGEASARRRAA